MPRIPESVIQEVRERADIVEVATSLLHLKLQQKGRDHWACCPFHTEKTPSFKINSQLQAFYCFGCHKTGNVFTLVQGVENLDFVEAVHRLARHLGVVIPEPGPETGPADREAADRQRQERDQGFQLLAQMAQWYQHRLTLPDAGAARDYLASRGLDPGTVTAFGIGYAPDSWDAALRWAEQLGYGRDLMVRTGMAVVREEDPARAYDRFRGRLMFPIWDERGRVAGFSGRILGAVPDAPKYINSPDTEFFHKGRILYAFHLARPRFPEHGGALVCEGQLDVIACHRAGLNHAVCSQGTAFTETHAQLLARATDAVTLAFDGDPAGEKAALATVQLLQRSGLKVSVVVLPEGEDPDSLFRRHGPQALREAVSRALEAVPFAYGLAARRRDAADPMGKAAIVEDVLPVILSLKSPVAQSAYGTWLAEQLKVEPGSVLRTLEDRRREEKGSRSAGARPPAAAHTRNRSAPAPLAVPLQRDPALTSLLDLALHFEPVARQLVDELPPDLVPDTPLGRALNRVLAATAAGEWSGAADAVAADQDLVVCPEVGRVLVQSEYADLADPDAAPASRPEERLERLYRAAAECIARRELDVIEAELRRLREMLAAETDKSRQEELLRRNCELQNRRREITQRRRQMRR